MTKAIRAFAMLALVIGSVSANLNSFSALMPAGKPFGW